MAGEGWGLLRILGVNDNQAERAHPRLPEHFLGLSIASVSQLGFLLLVLSPWTHLRSLVGSPVQYPQFLEISRLPLRTPLKAQGLKSPPQEPCCPLS